MSVTAYIERSIPFATGFFISVSVLVALGAKHNIGRTKQKRAYSCAATSNSKCRGTNKSPLASQTKPGSRISNKAIPLMHKKKAGDDDQDIEAPEIGTKEEGTGGFGKVFTHTSLVGIFAIYNSSKQIFSN